MDSNYGKQLNMVVTVTALALLTTEYTFPAMNNHAIMTIVQATHTILPLILIRITLDSMSLTVVTPIPRALLIQCQIMI